MAADFSPIGKNIVVYDLETKHATGEPFNNRKITWDDHDLMGIASLCLYDYRTSDYCVHMDDNMSDAVDRLNNADLVVGFNQAGFDEKVIRGSGYLLKKDLPNYDMLYEGRRGMGWRDGDMFPKGCKLQDFLIGTFGLDHGKTGEGSQAPVLYQTRQFGKLISYNLADVARTKKLFEHIWFFGTAKTPRHGVHTMQAPYKLMKLDAREIAIEDAVRSLDGKELRNEKNI